jgi:hypothetical protein
MENWRPIVAAMMILFMLSMVLAYTIVTDVANSFSGIEMDNFRRNVKSCEQARTKAKSDFTNGNIRMFFNSGFDDDRNGFPYNFYKQLEDTYAVKVVLAGDVGGEYFGCYNLTMDSLLSQRVGSETIEKLYYKLHAEKYRQ